MKIIFTLFMFLFISANAQDNMKGNEVKANFSYGLKNVSYCNFYEYKIYQETELSEDNPLLRKLQSEYKNANFLNSEKAPNNFLKIRSILKFVWKGKMMSYVNYDVAKNNEKTENITYLDDSEVEITPNIEEVLKLSNEAFWEFYNSENNSNYSEINKLKSRVQDSGGVLNIQKLAKVLEENKASLAKYLDE